MKNSTKKYDNDYNKKNNHDTYNNNTDNNTNDNAILTITILTTILMMMMMMLAHALITVLLLRVSASIPARTMIVASVARTMIVVRSWSAGSRLPQTRAKGCIRCFPVIA